MCGKDVPEDLVEVSRGDSRLGRLSHCLESLVEDESGLVHGGHLRVGFEFNMT